MNTDERQHLRLRLDRLNNPESRLELGEAARSAELSVMADQHLLDLLDQVDRLERVLYPRVVESPSE